MRQKREGGVGGRRRGEPFCFDLDLDSDRTRQKFWGFGIFLKADQLCAVACIVPMRFIQGVIIANYKVDQHCDPNRLKKIT